MEKNGKREKDYPAEGQDMIEKGREGRGKMIRMK